MTDDDGWLHEVYYAEDSQKAVGVQCPIASQEQLCAHCFCIWADGYARPDHRRCCKCQTVMHDKFLGKES